MRVCAYIFRLSFYILIDDELLKYAEPEDIWFHVSDLSSAHVYLKMQPGWTIGTIPEAVLTDCCQLVKANSIEGKTEGKSCLD